MTLKLLGDVNFTPEEFEDLKLPSASLFRSNVMKNIALDIPAHTTFSL